MNRVVLGVALGLALSSQAWAIIRSPFPAKTLPPPRGDVIVIGGNSIVRPAGGAPATTAKPAK